MQTSLKNRDGWDRSDRGFRPASKLTERAGSKCSSQVVNSTGFKGNKKKKKNANSTELPAADDDRDLMDDHFLIRALKRERMETLDVDAACTNLRHCRGGDHRAYGRQILNQYGVVGRLLLTRPSWLSQGVALVFERSICGMHDY